MAVTFLLVDDDADDTDLFCEALGEIDATVDCYCASNGKLALEKLTEVKSPGIIFMDINMPEMDGLACLSEIKKQQDLKNIPVMMYTTSANRQDTLAAKELGAMCFITKPNEFEHLKNILKTVISHVKSGTIDTLCKAITKKGLFAN